MVSAVLLAATIVGQPAPSWPDLRWVQGGPLSLGDLRGKVVLVRFFTDTQCPFCSATAPALNELDSDFRARGLVVVGFYTPKRFPVAIDDEWKALRRLWLDRATGAGWTSASLLIDRKGIVRRVHPGGVFSKDSTDPQARRDYRELRADIEELLGDQEAHP